MPYTKTVWVNGIAPALSAANLNNLEIQYEEAMADILTVAETEVFSGNSPLGWADLDISAVVGTNEALVMLKVGNTVNPQGVMVRINGDAEPTLASGSGSNYCTQGANEYTYIITATDANGIFEWITDVARNPTTVDVVAYVKRE